MVRSLMELRRLAYRAKRNVDAREVLHDALLETFPGQYGWLVSYVDKRAAGPTSNTPSDNMGDKWKIVFHPRRLRNWKKYKQHAAVLFDNFNSSHNNGAYVLEPESVITYVTRETRRDLRGGRW